MLYHRHIRMPDQAIPTLARGPIRLLVIMANLQGGTGVFCRNLARGLRDFHADRYRTSLLLFDDRGVTPDDRAQFHDVHVLGAPAHDDARRLYESAGHLLRLRSALRRRESDVILTAGTWQNLAVPAVAPRRLTVLTEHGNQSQRLREARFAPVMRPLIRRTFPKHLVICVTRGVADDMRDHFGVPRTHVIYHGLDVDRVRRLAKEPAPDLPGRPYLVSVGRLARQKDYPTLIRAYALARQRGLTTHDLVIVGDGPDRADLISLVRSLGLDGHVHLSGHRNNPFPYVAASDAFVLPSLWEGFGLVLLEAMALGKPVCSTDCPSGPAEILGNGDFGLLTPPGGVDAMASRLLSLATTPDLRRDLADRSARRVADFTIQRMADRYADVLAAEVARGLRPRTVPV